MNARIKREKCTNNQRVAKDQFVPVIIQEDATTFAAYTLQTFTEEEESDAITVASINVQEHHNGIPITHIIHTEEVEYDSTQEVEHQLLEGEEERIEEEEVDEEEEGEEETFEDQQQEYQIDVKDVSVSPNTSNSGYETGSFIAAEQSRSKTFYCPNCGNCYSAAGSLKLHIRACMRSKEQQPESESSRKCEICNKVFNSSSYLKEHMLRHTGKGPRKCTKCYRKFIDDAKYEAHMKTHNLEEKLGVATPDGKSTATASVATKKIVREYVCSFCSKKFTVIFDSRQTKRRYACDECREKYSNEEMLKQHKAALEEKREFHCERCGRKFIFEGFLQRHIPTCDGTIKRRRDRV